jgi:predicted TIM-barrel fold metal-dependent hydrolase
MRVDIHTYVGHWPFRQLRGNTCGALLSYMKRYGIDRAVVANLHGIFYKNTQPANEELAEAVRSYRAEFIPFAVINPTYAGWQYDLEFCRRKLGFKGVRLYPQYHDYQPSDARCAEAVRMATALGMAVAFSQRVVDDRQRSWLDPGRQLTLDEIALVVEQVPKGKFIVLNAMLQTVREAISQVFRRADILFDTVYATGARVGLAAYDLAEAVATYGADKFAFGTAAPFREPVTALLRVEVAKELDPASKELIWSGNALRFL